MFIKGVAYIGMQKICHLRLSSGEWSLGAFGEEDEATIQAKCWWSRRI